MSTSRSALLLTVPARIGAQRQYCGAVGKIANCQIAVSTALIADGLAWLTSMELYLPAIWAEDDERRTRSAWKPLETTGLQ
jgi:SRSO17 transposase